MNECLYEYCYQYQNVLDTIEFVYLLL